MKNNYNKELSIKDIIVIVSDYKNELKKRSLLIILITVIFSLIGVAVSEFKDRKYEAILSFIVEDQSGSVSQPYLTGVAEMVGFDLGSSQSSSFSQQNIIELLKSRNIIEKTLNNNSDIGGRLDLLLNHYIRINNLIDDSSSIDFSTNYIDSITNIVWLNIINQDMHILYQNDEANILNLSFKSLNDEFAKSFTEIIISEISEMYSIYQTEKTRISLNNLEIRSDSIFKELKSSERRLARTKDKNTRVITSSGRLSEIQYMREVQVLNSMYIELRKNIELTNMNLLHETPLIQVIDIPVLPLNVTNKSMLFWIIVSSSLGLFIIIFVIVLRKLVRDSLSEQQEA
tara:strand:- start:57 stop:1088 length:1032 start_codon:yes stop_codon:yes gene_type:complete